MAESRIDWGELVSEIATLGGESSDEATDESDESDESAESDESEATFYGSARPGFPFPINLRPMRVSDYGRNVRGQGQGVVQTPSGPAKIELPGRFPTVEEFKSSVEAIQKDVQKNANRIAHVSAVQRRDAVRLAGLVVRSERRLRRQLTRAQVISIAVAVAVPFVGRLIDQKLNP